MNVHAVAWILTSYVFVGCHSICSPLYGGEPCTFLPAPPGKTPPCARPGLTYCEHPDHYPGQLIHYLIQKWRYDHGTLLSSESKDDFTAYFYPAPSTVYGPPNYHNYGPNNVIPPSENYYPEPIYIPKPQYPFQDTGTTYIPPKVQNYTNGFGGYPVKKNSYQQQPSTGGQVLNYKYNNNIPPRGYTGQEYQPPVYYDAGPQATQYNNNIWKRRVEDNYTRFKRSLSYRRSQQTALRTIEGGSYANGTSIHKIKKRQSTITGEPLCQTRSQFIVPKAALNNKGNWMYVVNMPEVDSRYTQLVKSEVCVSQTCNGICSLPQGYSSRCEQKYVQKRLVALEGSGNELYTDVFWFPSCCVCTISNS